MLEIVGSFLFKKKEVLLQLSDVIFQNLYLGKMQECWCGPCVLELGSVMVTEVVPGLIFCLALYFRIFLNLLNLLFKVSKFLWNSLRLVSGPWTMTVPLW